MELKIEQTKKLNLKGELEVDVDNGVISCTYEKGDAVITDTITIYQLKEAFEGQNVSISISCKESSIEEIE